jgi:hypothetical protein
MKDLRHAEDVLNGLCCRWAARESKLTLPDRKS